MTLEAAKEMDKCCVLNWLNEVYVTPSRAFNEYTDDELKMFAHDAIVLLKEQETEWEKIWEAPDGTYKGRCKRCGFVHIFIENHDLQYNFCPSCGRSVV